MIAPEQVSSHLADLSPYVSQACEVQLLDYSGLAPYGAWAKFRLSDVAGLKGYKTGQRFHLILIAIMEDEMPASQNPEKRHPYKLSQLAGMLCSQEDFRHWVTEVYGEPCHNKDEAADWVRKACNVASRSHLDSDAVAGDTWKAIMASFDEFKQQQEGGA